MAKNTRRSTKERILLIYHPPGTQSGGIVWGETKKAMGFVGLVVHKSVLEVKEYGWTKGEKIAVISFTLVK